MATTALIATADPRIADDLLRLAAAANAEATVAATVDQARADWRRPPLVLVGADMADRLAAGGLSRRTGVVLVTGGASTPEDFRSAVLVGAQDLAALPDDEEWLVNALAAAAEPQTDRAVTVCVTGARGGAGASVLSAMLGLTAAHRGVSTLLIDGDPRGGGIDLVLGAEDAPGSRWPDLAGRRGRLSAELLRRSLPTVADLAVLSWHRGDPVRLDPDGMRTVLDAALRGFDLIVVDLARQPGEAGRLALRAATRAFLVVPAELRAVAAADQLAADLRGDADDIRLLIREPSPEGLTPEVIARTLDLPLAGAFRDDRRLPAAVERGEFPRLSRRGSLPALCDRLLEDLPVPRPALSRSEAA